MAPSDLPPPPNEIPSQVARQQQQQQMPLQVDPNSGMMAHMQQQQYSQQPSSNVGGVDLSRLQPSPMDQLRPRQHNDPPWAPHHYIQKGKRSSRVLGVHCVLNLLQKFRFRYQID